MTTEHTAFNNVLAAQLTEADLAPLLSKVPPAILNSARTVMVAARATGRTEEYAETLALLKSVDASALLGGPIADAAHAEDGAARSEVEEVLLRHGITPARAAELRQRYNFDDRPEAR